MSYSVGELTNHDFKTLRQGLLMTQLELAQALGYSHKIRISEYERATNPLPIPLHIQEAVLKMARTGKTKAAVRVWERRAG